MEKPAVKTADNFKDIQEASYELVGKTFSDVEQNYCIRDVSAKYTDDLRPYRINVIVESGIIKSVSGFY